VPTTTTEVPTTTTVVPTTTAVVPTTTSGSPSDCEEADRKCSEGYSGSFCMTYKLPSVCWGSNAPCSCARVSTSTTTQAATGQKCYEEDLRCASLKESSYCKHWEYPSICWGTTEPCSCN
ncbi:hypothetical protein FOZ63_028690, partial [Perkinsus olseni]